MVTAASTYMFEATEKRFYLKNVSILIPESWGNKPQYRRPGQESYAHVSVNLFSTRERGGRENVFWCLLVFAQIDWFIVFLTYFFCSSSFNDLFKHSQADVKVAPPAVPGRDEPYTRQFTNCGERAEYIHFTPDVVLGKKEAEYGPTGGTWTLHTCNNQLFTQIKWTDSGAEVLRSESGLLYLLAWWH